MTLPNFFVVGAPKCGTTALHAYLRGHPDVFMSDPKEPHFFGADLVFTYGHRRTREEYEALFAGAGGRRRIGEASVWYLYSSAAAVEIGQVVPDARIIAMLRNPAEMIPSLHRQLVYNGHEVLPLDQALDAEEARAAGRRIPPQARFPRALLYRRVASYSEQLERYFAVFGREAVRVIVFDDFKADTPKTYADTLRFLGVDDTHRPALDVINASKRSRSIRFRRMLNDPPGWLRTVARHALPASVRPRVYRSLVSLNSDRLQPGEPDAAVLARIRHDMTPEIERLSELLSRDFSSWLRASPSSLDPLGRR